MRCALIYLAFAPACGQHEPPAAAPPPKPAAKPVAAAPVTRPADPCSRELAALGPGMFSTHVPLGATPIAGGPPCIDIVRAEPGRYRLRVLTATRDGTARTAPVWRDTFDLAAVTNAGMFHEGAAGLPVGLIVENDFAVGSDNPKLGGVLAFDPRSPDDPPIVVAGRTCDGFDLSALRERYRSLVESYRLLDCDGAAIHWGDPKHYSAAVIGIDRSGRIVLAHARAALTMSELSRALASSNLDLAGALFLEGGPEASLLARGKYGEVSRVGSYETGFLEADTNQEFWSLPNVIALEPR